MRPEQKQVWAWGRVRVFALGKHGDKDCRAEFCESAPSLAEWLALGYALFRAEDRYDQPGQEGRNMLRDKLDAVFWAEDTAAVEEILHEVEGSIRGRGCDIAA